MVKLKMGRGVNALQELRLRGVVHPVGDQAGIPGWSQVQFILYKPCMMYLTEILLEYFEHHDTFPKDGSAVAHPKATIAAQLSQLAEWHAKWIQAMENLTQGEGDPVASWNAVIQSFNTATQVPPQPLASTIQSWSSGRGPAAAADATTVNDSTTNNSRDHVTYPLDLWPA